MCSSAVNTVGNQNLTLPGNLWKTMWDRRPKNWGRGGEGLGYLFPDPIPHWLSSSPVAWTPPYLHVVTVYGRPGFHAGENPQPGKKTDTDA